jgi:hypothetical protein
VANIVELEAVSRSQANRIAELEATCADFKRQKDKVTDGYWRLAEKHKSLAEKAEHDKKRLTDAHAAEVTKLDADLDLEIHSYTEYLQTMRHWLHELHEAVASWFEEVKAQCLPFPDKGAKLEEMIDSVVGEVKAIPGTVWRLSDNFTVLGIEGVLCMLNDKGCQELGRLHDLASSRDVVVLEDVPEDVHRLVGRIVWKWWKPHGLSQALRRLEEARTETVSDCSYWELLFLHCYPADEVTISAGGP